jgi:cellulose synthase operon protein C
MHLRMNSLPFMCGSFFLLAVTLLVPVAGQVAAQAPSEAEKLLARAQDAYAQKNYAAVTQRFRELVTQHGKTPSGPAAKFGLAVCLIEGHDKQYTEALRLLESIDDKAFHGPQVSYFQAAAERGLATESLAQAAAKPKDAAKLQDVASRHWTRAAQLFGEARDGFGKLLSQKKAMTDPMGTQGVLERLRAREAEMLKEHGPNHAATKRARREAEQALDNLKQATDTFAWTALATCDLAEMQIRLGDYQAAIQETKGAFDNPSWQLSKHRTLAIYYHGFASFMRGDRAAAEKSLSMLAPFRDVRFGTHARYLLARLFHLDDERAEAALHYEGVLNDFNREKKEAKAALQNLTEMARDPN